MYSGPYAIEAARRYEEVWLPMLADRTPEEFARMVPPLDVAFAWLVHRLNPVAYVKDLQALSVLASSKPTLSAEWARG